MVDATREREWHSKKPTVSNSAITDSSVIESGCVEDRSTPLGGTSEQRRALRHEPMINTIGFPPLLSSNSHSRYHHPNPPTPPPWPQPLPATNYCRAMGNAMRGILAPGNDHLEPDDGLTEAPGEEEEENDEDLASLPELISSEEEDEH